MVSLLRDLPWEIPQSSCLFAVMGSAKFGSTLKGTRPGHPYVDVVFFFCVPKKVLEDFARALVPRGLKPLFLP